jgi:hypothetical protein
MRHPKERDQQEKGRKARHKGKGSKGDRNDAWEELWMGREGRGKLGEVWLFAPVARCKSRLRNRPTMKVQPCRVLKTAKTKSPSFPNYAVIRKDCPVGGGGSLVILVHSSVSFTHLDTSTFSAQDQHIELLAICAEIEGSKYNIFNIYIPPDSATNNYSPDFDGLFSLGDNEAFYFGDFNALRAEWFSSLSNTLLKAVTSSFSMVIPPLPSLVLQIKRFFLQMLRLLRPILFHLCRGVRKLR